MPDTLTQPPEVLRSDGTDGRRRNTFLPGTAKPEGSGKKAGTAGRLERLREFAKKCAFDTIALPNGMKVKIEDPAEMLMYIALVGRDPLEGVINEKLGDKAAYAAAKATYTDDEGKVHAVAGFVDVELRVDCAVKLLPYMRPKLSSVEMTGEGGKPLFERDSENAKQLSRDPEIRKLFEKVQEKMTQGETINDDQT